MEKFETILIKIKEGDYSNNKQFKKDIIDLLNQNGLNKDEINRIINTFYKDNNNDYKNMLNKIWEIVNIYVYIKDGFIIDEI